jgi:hypothetical protein
MAKRPPDNLRDMQAGFNRSTATHWDDFRSHRQHIEDLILADGVADSIVRAGRLCVLGAGNCNDLDLKRFIEVFAEVHLVDLDASALERAVRRQGVQASPKLKLHGGVDLTGVADVLSGWRGRSPSSREIDECLQGAAHAPQPHVCSAGGFTVVLSPCLLSQLVGYASDMLGGDHPRAIDLRLAIRRRHLRLMVDLLAPGGAGVLVTDLAVSGMVKNLEHVCSGELPDLLRRLVAQRKVFAGLDPEGVEAALTADPLVAPLLGAVQYLPPWLWRLGPLKTFLVYALRFRRSGGAVLLGGGAA